MKIIKNDHLHFFAIDLNKIKDKDIKNFKFFRDKDCFIFPIDKRNFCIKKFNWEIRNFFINLKSIKDLTKKIDINVDSFLALVDKSLYQSVINILLVNYELLFNNKINYKSNKKIEIEANFIISKNLKNLVDFANNLVLAYKFAHSLQLLPNNQLNPDDFSNIVKKEFKQFQSLVEIRVLNKKELIAKKMNLILAVGQASDQKDEPKLLTIKFRNRKPKFTLIGKGITFDTGGICLKPSNYLKGMEWDMSGAAVAVGVMYALCLNKQISDFGVVIPLAKNDIGPNTTKTGDIIKSYDGASVEITNTDAEGRLILADAISYAIKDWKADTISTIATLTGAIIIAFDNVYSGYFTESKELNKKIKQASKISGEYIWGLPLNSIFDEKIHISSLADLNNCLPGPNASSILGASFLKYFAKEKEFIHFDIAGTNEVKINSICSIVQPAMLSTLFYFVKDNYAK